MYDKNTEDELEKEIQKYQKLADEPGSPWGNRRRVLADDDEEEEVTDLRGGEEGRALNTTLDRMSLKINIQKKTGIQSENTTD